MKEAGGAAETPIFNGAWAKLWSKASAPPPSLPLNTAVHALDLAGMVSRPIPNSEMAAKRLTETVRRVLDEMLASGEEYWSPAPAVIQVGYRGQTPQSIEIKHNVVSSAIERSLQDVLGRPAPAARGESAKPRRVDWESFQRLCQRAKARPEQIHILDIPQVLFGAPDPTQRLSQRIWTRVDEIVDEFLEANGFCTRYPGNQILLLFPGLSKSLGDLKTQAISNEIARAFASLTRHGADQEAEAPAPRPAPLEAPRRTPAASPTSDKEALLRAQANQAFAAMAAARNADLLTQDDLELPPDVSCRFVPTWRSDTRHLIGQMLEPVRKTRGEKLERVLPPAPDEADPLDLPCLARAIERITGLVRNQNMFLTLVCVQWSTLDQKKWRNKYLDLCSRIPEEGRRLLVIGLNGIPEDLLAARVEERIRQLRRYARGVICTVALERQRFHQFDNQAAHAVGVDLGAEAADERQAFRLLDRFMDATDRLPVKTFAHGVASKSLMMASLAAGFDYIAGSVFGDDVEPNVRQLTIPDLYEGLDPSPS